MHSRFPKTSFPTRLRTLAFVLVAFTAPCLFSQAISFGNIVLIPYPDSTTYMPVAAVPGDLNGDGKTDLVLFTQTPASTTPYSSRLLLLTGDGTGNFTSKTLPITPHPGSKFLLADVNGDGHQDILYIYGGVAATDAAPGYWGALQVWLGDGQGNFHESSTTPLSVGDVSAELGDFNHDGKRDVAVLTSYDPNSSDPFTHESYLDVFINLGNGFYKNTYTVHDTVNYEFLGPVGDYNRDAKSDLILISESRNTFRVLSGNGDGTFIDPHRATYTLNNEYIIAMVTSDLNGDRKSDLVVSLFPVGQTNVPPKIATLLAKQTTGFYWYDDTLPVGRYSDVQMADLNGDGKPDLFYYDEDGGNIGALAGEANAQFGPEQHIGFVWPANFVVAAPLKSGALPDLFFMGQRMPGQGFLEVMLNVSK